MRGVFVTGTDTGVGKSIAAGAICAGLASRGLRVAAFKPAVTGLDEPQGEWPPDHELLAGAASAGQTADEVAPYRFGPPASPHYAAELAAARIDPERLLAEARAAAELGDALVVEGVGGLLVPLRADYLVRDLAADLGLGAIVVARPGLGTINHALLTIEAARSSGLAVRGAVLTPWPAEPDGISSSNRATIASIAGVEVSDLPWVEPGALAEAGAALPLERWIGPA